MYCQYQKSFPTEPGIRWCSGIKGKNRPRPKASLESPASTPTFSMHFPISTSSAPLLEFQNGIET